MPLHFWYGLLLSTVFDIVVMFVLERDDLFLSWRYPDYVFSPDTLLRVWILSHFLLNRVGES